jgi:hypothetical protein
MFAVAIALCCLAQSIAPSHAEATGAVQVSGVVHDAEGAPIPPAYAGNSLMSVTLINSSGDHYDAHVAVDGSYIAYVAPGTYTVELQGGVNPNPAWPATVDYAVDNVDLSASRTLDLTLPLLVLTVSVTDSNGDPVSGAVITGRCNDSTIELFPGSETAGAWSARAGTDDTGTVEMGVLPCTTAKEFVATPPANATLAATRFTVPPLGDDTSVAVELVTFGGTLTNGAGHAIADQVISLESGSGLLSGAVFSDSPRGWSSVAASIYSSVTNTQGIFKFTVPLGSYRLNLTGGSTSGAGLPKNYDLSVSAFDLSVPALHDMTLRTVSLDVTVLGPDGHPVGNALLGVPCTAVKPVGLLPGYTANGTQCGAGKTNSSGLAHVGLFPSASFELSVEPPLGSALVQQTLRNLSITQTKSLIVRLSSSVADTTPPTASAPVGNLFAPQVLGTTAKLHLAWPAATDPSGIARYELMSKKGAGSWLAVTLSSPTALSVDLALTPNASYAFRLRATDGAGNTGAWLTTTGAKLGLLQETATSITYAGTWKRAALTGSSGGYVRQSAVAGRLATFHFTGSSVALVSTLAKARGQLEIRLDAAATWTTLDLYASSTQTRRIVWASGHLTVGAHTLEVRLKGTRNTLATSNRVDIDAFLVWP